jgi:hypothetical protein
MTLQEVSREDTEDPTLIRQAYKNTLQEAITQAGADTIASETTVEADRIAAITDGNIGDLRLRQAAEIAAVRSDMAADTIIAEIRDDLLMGMATAVLDVDTVAAKTDLDLTGQEIQQALEGRTRMTMTELSSIQAVISTRK